MNTKTSDLKKWAGTRTLKGALWFTAVFTLLLNVQAQIPSLVITQRWSLAPGSRFDLPNAANNTERGIAYNKTTGHVLLASRNSSNHIAVLSGLDGSEVGIFGGSAQISGGTLALVHVRVADDGVIYACNLTAATSALKIYRWDSEADALLGTAALVAFGPAAPGAATTQRYGDSMDLRGAGTNTQIVISGSGSTVYSVFTTTDGTNFTATEFTHALGAGELGKGVSFDGTNNNLYGKKDGSLNLHKVAFDIPTATSTFLTNVVLPTGDNNVVGTKYASRNGVQFIVGGLSGSGTTAAAHRFKAYTINNPAAVSVSADVPYPSPYLTDGNVLGANDIADGVIVSEQSNNGIMMFGYTFVTNLPPNIVTQPQDNTNVLAGGYVSFSVGASGTDPKTYRWKFNDATDVPGGTSNTLTLSNVTAANSGFYKCAVTNSSGFAISSNATLGVIPSAAGNAVLPLWSKSVGDAFFLGNDNQQRGLGYNRTTGHLIVVSRTPSNGVHIVNADTGAYFSSLDMSTVALGAGTFLINLGGAAADGAIYAANLDTGGTVYTIYRWADESPATVATVAFGPGDPGGVGRVGDTFAVRGAGVGTQILIGSRNGTQVILFTTTDGLIFSPTVIDTTPEPAGLAGLGIAFGAGDTFWTKSSGSQFRHLAFDLVNSTNGLLQTFTNGQNTANTVAVDPVNDYLAATSLATPDNVQFYDVHDVLTGAATEPALLDQDFFKTDNENGNGTGAVVFDVAGGRLFALDSNNGLLALKYGPRLFQTSSGSSTVLRWTGPGALQASTNVIGTYVDVAGATSPYTNALSGSLYFRVKR